MAHRLGSLVIACGLALGVLGAPGVRAQECEADADCNNEGKVCTIEPDFSECEWKGCTGDDDCPDGFACEPDDVATATCASADGGCPEPEPVEPSGRCRPQPVTCVVDADCPNGLVCMDECASSDASDESCERGSSVCRFSISDCASDADCNQDGFACVVSERDERCTVGESRCVPGEVCEEPPERRDAGCEIVERKACLPVRVDCQSDADCDDRWSCFELPDPEDAPPDWQDATHVCFPEGWTMALQGQIEAGAFGRAESGSAGGGGKGTLGGRPDADSDAEATEDDDGGCAVGAVDARGRPAWPALALFALVLIRQRRKT